MMKIEESIQQSKFQDEHEKAVINLFYTSNWMSGNMQKMLKPFDLSQQQFNILRILRGQKGKPASLKVITERMLDPMSNTSRLVDKMMSKGLLERQICPDNRRQVEIVLTEYGLEICNQVSDLIDNERSENKKISAQEAAELNRILDKMRT